MPLVRFNWTCGTSDLQMTNQEQGQVHKISSWTNGSNLPMEWGHITQLKKSSIQFRGLCVPFREALSIPVLYRMAFVRCLMIPVHTSIVIATGWEGGSHKNMQCIKSSKEDDNGSQPGSKVNGVHQIPHQTKISLATVGSASCARYAYLMYLTEWTHKVFGCMACKPTYLLAHRKIRYVLL